VARSIHDYSGRPLFTPVNCGAIPGELFEAVVFGHEKIFTGADRRRDGLWLETGTGTLFLDEIADLRMDHQVKILRALQEKKVRPVGKTKEMEAPARVIAASNRDLFSLVKANQFREDLYYRLRAFMIRTPPLSDYPDDIPLLLQSFWKDITGDPSAFLAEAVCAQLQAHRWPGNAREVKAVLSNLFTLFGKKNIGQEHVRAVLRLQGNGARQQGKESRDEILLHKVECLRHLNRVDEVVHACRVTLSPVVDQKRTDAQTVQSVMVTLRYRLNELELLCTRPLLFHSEIVFTVVHRLKGRLSYLLSTLQSEPQRILRQWKKEVADEFKLALSTVFQEVSRLTGP
jgi:DNA-binding NtrC family response regulator